MLTSVNPAKATTFRSVAHDRIERLCRALEAPATFAPRARSIFDMLSDTWGELKPRKAPLWPSDICDDGTPFEFSLAFGEKGLEFRMLVEPQRSPFTLASNWEAGLAIAERLARLEGADLERFDRIRDLFAPTAPSSAAFSLWHAVVIEPTGEAFFKVYLNPQIEGQERAPLVVREALRRLDLPDAADSVDARAGGPDALRYFSLDLIPGGKARAKIYIGRGGSAEELEELVEGARDFERDRAKRWLERLTGSAGPFEERPILACLAFDHGDTAPSATVHVPIRCYCPDDATALERIAEFLPPREVAQLRRAAASLAERDLHRSRGLVTYASIRPEAKRLRTTVYLAPQIHEFASAQPSAAIDESPASPTNMREVELEIDRRCEVFLEHPLLRRLEGEGTIADVRALLPRLAFFVGAFQDILRLSYSRCAEPRLREVARSFVDGDRGHELWYLSDMARLGIPVDVPWLFSEHHIAARDTAYAFVGLATHAVDDRSRIAVTLVLEGCAALFFPRMAGFIARLGADDGLSYFDGKHVAAEAAHEAFTDEGQSLLSSIEVSAEALVEIRATVETATLAMRELADDLEQSMRALRRAA